MQSWADVATWARSGAMALTGRPGGPPVLPPGNAASQVRSWLAKIGGDIPGILGERAAYAGLHRNGPWNCGRTMRILPALGGHVALSLARPDDFALIPALIEGEPPRDIWDGITAWASRRSVDEIDERLTLLGLPGGRVRTQAPARPGVVSTLLGTRRTHPHPTVVDLTALWAGPLCAHLLGKGGASVIKVESMSRPDGARQGPPDFYALLHNGHRSETLDFTQPRDIAVLRTLLENADLVLESSRPRGLQQLGIDAHEVVAQGTSWLSITAAGREHNAVGFGDDVAARAGLVVADGADLLPVGDAIADPLVGVRAAYEASAALADDRAYLIDVSMIDVVAETLGPRAEHQVVRSNGSWWVEHEDGRTRVWDPQRRP